MREEEEYDEALLLSFIGQAKMHFSLFSPSPVRLLHVRPSFLFFFRAYERTFIATFLLPPPSLSASHGEAKREKGGGL